MKPATKPSPLVPSPSLLAKLGSIAVHAEELISSKGHSFDMEALKALLKDAEVRQWLDGMSALTLLPEKR